MDKISSLKNEIINTLDINKALVEVNDLLKSETNAKVSTRLVDLRKTLEQYKKIGEATVKRLEKEAKTNVVEKALTDKDTEVSPNDAATIEFNLKEINEAGGKIRKAANNDKNAKKRPRNKIGTKLQVLFPEVWKSLNKKTKTRIINEVADKENITVDDIITAFKNHTDSDQLDVAKEKLLKQNEEELSTPAVDYEEDWNDLIIEQQAEAEEAVQRKITEVEDLQQANADLIDNMKMSTLYTNPETGELIPEFTKIIEDYENGIISPDKLGESLEKVDRCLRGNY